MRQNYVVLLVHYCQTELVCFGSVLGLWCNACVRETMPEPVILAQARYAGTRTFSCSRLSLRRRILGLGERSSRLGE